MIVQTTNVTPYPNLIKTRLKLRRFHHRAGDYRELWSSFWDRGDFQGLERQLWLGQT
ncbi:MAG: hypothetical protein LBT09_09690 [Planctomycetaceae bacterium]|jgi:hypothetical protein|nr:hypothetical protein [Planctomycetaceae bacterium]